jgi:RsbRD-like negative regulator of sigma factor
MADEIQRAYALLGSSEQELLDRWVDVAAMSLRGRLTRAELEHSSRDLLTALMPALDLGGLDIRSDASGSATSRSSSSPPHS